VSLVQWTTSIKTCYDEVKQNRWIRLHYSQYSLKGQTSSKINAITRNKTRKPAVTRIADLTGCQRPSKSSKIDDFHFIWKSVCHFVLVINTVTLAICFRDMASFPLNFLPPPLHSTPNWKMFPLHGWNFACLSLTQMANYSCKKFSPNYQNNTSANCTVRIMQQCNY